MENDNQGHLVIKPGSRAALMHEQYAKDCGQITTGESAATTETAPKSAPQPPPFPRPTDEQVNWARDQILRGHASANPAAPPQEAITAETTREIALNRTAAEAGMFRRQPISALYIGLRREFRRTTARPESGFILALSAEMACRWRFWGVQPSLVGEPPKTSFARICGLSLPPRQQTGLGRTMVPKSAILIEKRMTADQIAKARELSRKCQSGGFRNCE